MDKQTHTHTHSHTHAHTPSYTTVGLAQSSLNKTLKGLDFVQIHMYKHFLLQNNWFSYV